MKEALLGTAFLGLLGLAAPRPAAARVSVFVGLPGFALFAGPPMAVAPAPVVVAPPPVVVGPSLLACQGPNTHEERETSP